ncbi:MAG: glycosyltransferase family 4 protein [Cyanobacteria bacterium P01_A01_bin.135]
MKILLTIHEAFLPDSGSAGSTFRLGEAYRRLGHDVTFFSLDDMPKLQRQAKRFVFPEFVAARVASLQGRGAIDVVDSAPGDNWLCGLTQQLSCRFPQQRQRPAIITRSHGLQHLEHLWSLEEARQGRLHLSWFYSLYRGGYLLWEVANSLRYADRAFFLNQKEADYACAHLQVRPERIRIFPNGIPEGFVGLPLSPLPPPDAPVRIAQIGTYIQRKGIEYSVPALKTILKHYPQVELSFVGTGFSELDAPEELVYQDFEPAFHHRIKVIPRYAHDALPALLQGHQITVFPSLSEGFGKALVEAMACGLAPITTDADGPMEIVQPNHDAIVVPRRDSAALQTAIEALLTSRERLATLRQNAYSTAQRYSWEAIAKARLAEYESVLQCR